LGSGSCSKHLVFLQETAGDELERISMDAVDAAVETCKFYEEHVSDCCSAYPKFLSPPLNERWISPPNNICYKSFRSLSSSRVESRKERKD